MKSWQKDGGQKNKTEDNDGRASEYFCPPSFCHPLPLHPPIHLRWTRSGNVIKADVRSIWPGTACKPMTNKVGDEHR
jgi:hypothetical protein